MFWIILDRVNSARTITEFVRAARELKAFAATSDIAEHREIADRTWTPEG